MMTTDNDILKFYGGSDINSLCNIVQFNNDPDDESIPLEVIQHSSYYDHDQFRFILTEIRNNFCI